MGVGCLISVHIFSRAEIKVRVDAGREARWTPLAKRNWMEWTYAERDNCKRVKNVNENANDEYELQDRPTYFTDMCRCTKKKYAPLTGYEPSLESDKPLLPIRDLRNSYYPSDPMDDCYELKLYAFEKPDKIWVRLWLKEKNCRYTKQVGNVKYRQKPVFGNCGAITALDSVGLPFGMWLPDAPKDCPNPNACIDNNKARVIHDTTYGSEICQKPPGYEKIDPV